MSPVENVRFKYLRRVVAPVLGALGVDRTEGLALWLARGVHAMRTPGGGGAAARIRAAYGESADEAATERVVGGMYANIARFWTEALFLRRLMRPSTWRRYVRIVGEAELRRLSRDRRGCVLATAYFGNPAAAAVALGAIFRPVYVLADVFQQAALSAWQRDAYAFPNVQIVDGRRDVARIADVLERGGALFMICEHERARGAAVESAFCGRTLRIAPTLDRLSRCFGAPVAAVTCRREPRTFRFVLTHHATARWAPGRSSAEDAAATRAISDGHVTRTVLSALERAILADPEQYLWRGPNPISVAQASRPRSHDRGDGATGFRDGFLVRAQ